MPRIPEVWAHRGWASRYPENTLPAFQAALGLGVQGIELDVHLTKDEQIVVIHDARLERTTNGTGTVNDHTLDELKRLDAGAWFDPSFDGTGIPTLSEVLALMGAHPTPIALNVEVKVGESVYPELEQMVWKQIMDFGLEDRSIVSSFHHGLLRNLKRRYPAARIGLLCQHLHPEPWAHAKEFGASAIHPQYSAVDSNMVERLHREGIAVNVWTVDNPEDISEMKTMGVDAIISNFPDRALEIVSPQPEIV